MVKLILFVVIAIPIAAAILMPSFSTKITNNNNPNTMPALLQTVSPTPSPLPVAVLPSSKVLQNDYHIFQTFNNCGPASLSMALSFYGISQSQQEIGLALRPYQHPRGDNDDKSTTLEELANYSTKFGFVPYHRPNGSIEKLKMFIAIDLPVITRTWLTENEDIGHYRVVKGYEETTQQIVQDDSLQNKNLRFTYTEFNKLWEKFNYEYLVLVPKDKKQQVEAILGDEIDQLQSWKKAVQSLETKQLRSPNDIATLFNLSVAYYHIGEYQKSIDSFEEVKDQLPFRTLWYQIEPIQAYAALGKDDVVLSLTQNILNNQNRAFSELYIIRGKIYQKRGDTNRAKSEFEKAVFYNKNLPEAKELLENIS